MSEEQQSHTSPGAQRAPGDGAAPVGAKGRAEGNHSGGSVAGAHVKQAKVADVPAAAHPQQDLADVEGDLDELVRTAAQRDEYLALAQRTQADFENYRKRVARESAAAGERGVLSLAKELLPALDNLDRAIGHADQEDPLLEGVRLVRSELAAALARVGIESYSPAGEPFDPSLHEAVATAPSPEDGPGSGAVLEVYQDGYRLGETVIRPARVVVVA